MKTIITICLTVIAVLGLLTPSQAQKKIPNLDGLLNRDFLIYDNGKPTTYGWETPRGDVFLWNLDSDRQSNREYEGYGMRRGRDRHGVYEYDGDGEED